VAEFLVELYVSRTEPLAAEQGAARARLVAEQLTREGTPVRCLRSIFVPEDETCFYLYEADSADDVRVAVERAGLPFERVAAAVTNEHESSESKGGER
jgi:hypothetical protein